jgi:hypothetical protein
LLYIAEHIRRLNTLKVAMIAFASLIVIAHLAETGAPIRHWLNPERFARPGFLRNVPRDGIVL